MLVNATQKVVDVPPDIDMSEFILRSGSNYVIGASFNETDVVAWFNSEYYHSTALSLNIVNQAILKTLLGQEHEINVINKPYDFFQDKSNVAVSEELLFEHITMVLLLFYIVWLSYFLAPYIKDRSSGIKSLQYVQGVGKFTYWITYFVFDVLMFSTIALLLVITAAILNHRNLSTILTGFSKFYIISVFFGIAVLPFLYYLSFWFKKSLNARVYSIIINLITGRFSLSSI